MGSREGEVTSINSLTENESDTYDHFKINMIKSDEWQTNNDSVKDIDDAAINQLKDLVISHTLGLIDFTITS